MYGMKEERRRITKETEAMPLRSAAALAAVFLAAAVFAGFAGLSGCGREEAVVLETASSVGEAEGGAAGQGPESGAADEEPEGGLETAVSEIVSSQVSVSETPAPELIQVHVCGAVKRPGVYELPADSRVFEAVETAGGMAEDAAADYLNLADAVFDGAKVRVPFLSELSGEERYGPSGSYGVTGSQAAGGSYAAEPAGESDDLVDLNHADKTALMGLPGIGEAKAEAIISWREEHGLFGSPEDIMQVPGIKEAAYEKMKDKVTVKN